jgi:hypothetical protein
MGGRGRGLHGEAVSLSDVLSYVENWTVHPLVDKTRLQGLHRIETSGWLPMQPGTPPPPGAKAEAAPTCLTSYPLMEFPGDAPRC